MKNVKFFIRRVRSPFGHQWVALAPGGGKIFSMKKLGKIYDYYAVKSEPVFNHDKRPTIDYFEFEMEDHMYTAFLLAET